MTPYDGLPHPQRAWAILSLVLGVTLAILDSSIATVALPAIATDLHVTPAQSIWVVNAYQIVVVVSMLVLSSLGEIIGYRRIFQAGLLLFTVTSLVCALSDSLLSLTIARALQGLGAAGIMSVTPALVKTIYPQRLLGRGAGVNALTSALASSLGPTIASGILAIASWPWLFAINVPLGILAAGVAWRALPANPHPATYRFDRYSAVLNVVVFALLFAVVDGIGHGAAWYWVLCQVVALLGFGYVFVQRQLGQAAPLLPLDLLRIPVFALSIITSICSFTAQMLAYVSLPFYLHGALGRSAVEIGLLMTPWPLSIALIAPLAGWLADRYSPGMLSAAGMLIFAAGLACLASMPLDPSTFGMMWRMVICGLGFGLFSSPNNYLILSSAPEHRSGGASGMLGTARLVGQTLGTTLVAILFVSFPQHGTVIALEVAIAFALLAAGLSSLRALQRAQEVEKDEPAA